MVRIDAYDGTRTGLDRHCFHRYHRAVSLRDLIHDPHAPIDDIARYLDERPDHDARMRQLIALSRDAQRALYEKAAHASPIDIEHFVGHIPTRLEVVHEGCNTLPLPAPLKRFQKRFCRADHHDNRLYGYNEGPTRRLIGPGYFVAVPTDDRPQWRARGAFVVDYFQVPDGEVAAGWPVVIPNHRGLQRFVYHRTRDFMRRVSVHVSVGAAFKNERPMDHYFVLCRHDETRRAGNRY